MLKIFSKIFSTSYQYSINETHSFNTFAEFIVCSKLHMLNYVWLQVTLSIPPTLATIDFLFY